MRVKGLGRDKGAYQLSGYVQRSDSCLKKQRARSLGRVTWRCRWLLYWRQKVVYACPLKDFGFGERVQKICGPHISNHMREDLSEMDDDAFLRDLFLA